VDNAEPTAQTTKSSGSQKFILPLILLSILIIAGAGAYMFLAKNTSEKQDSKAVVAETVPSPTTGTVISSIKEALAGSQSIRCDFTDETGRQTTSYLKSGSVRTDYTGADPDDSGSMLMKDETLYIWNGKEGTKMAFDMQAMMNKAGSIAPTATKKSSTSDQEEFLSTLEKYKESCKPATVDDALFTPPADVKFTDLSSMMQKATQSIPTGGLTEEQKKALEELTNQ
jgi:hypothetical protein